MIQVKFPDGLSEIKLPALSQWDYNRKLYIAGINTTNNVLQVHFSNEFSRVAIVRVAYKEGETWQVNIPNVLLQERYKIYAYIYLNEDESGKTVKKIIIPVLPRQRPDDYPQNSYEEAELNRLIDYTNKLGGQVSRYANILAEYQSKKWVKPITKAEYNALVDAGKVENDVLYCFTDVSVVDEIAGRVQEPVIEAITNGIESGDIPIGEVESAANVTDSINGVPLTDIFDEDGETVLKAAYAEEAKKIKSIILYSGKAASGDTLTGATLVDRCRYAIDFKYYDSDGTVWYTGRTTAIAFANGSSIDLQADGVLYVYGYGVQKAAFLISMDTITNVTSVKFMKHISMSQNAESGYSFSVEDSANIYITQIDMLEKY